MKNDLPPLRDVIAAHKLGARKSLGQHFLLDLNLTQKIAREAGDLSGKIVIEIGPGPGGLTRALVETEAKAILAIEKDPRCLAALETLVEKAGGRLRIIEADALRLDPAELTPPPRVVIANLPYNVGTALLVAWLHRAQDYEQFVLMFQKEVAERIVAQPGTSAYGRLSVLCQYCCDCKILFTVPACAFTPPPKVDSAVIRLIPKKEALPLGIAELERVTALAFGQRRKMLRGIFKGHLSDADFEKLGIAPTARAEELSVEQHVELAKAFHK
ncbi:MAG TPA: 16S rRNA (adenine(1518)-N(6)/adenine(1519)-N(6))-dimethyltransferase RsmA [Alphaproteobacteria bacterium]|nr:16S rRNA (adenine(1518)-N(6)/adenine(1519)-N(6))-dimethyltransferase RsmA [Alphaproteobacteria bacterium]